MFHNALFMVWLLTAFIGQWYSQLEFNCDATKSHNAVAWCMPAQNVCGLILYFPIFVFCMSLPEGINYIHMSHDIDPYI